eukprot:gene7664-8500_t
MASGELCCWKDDEELKLDLERYVRENLRRKEILDFVSRDYPVYLWSLGTLARRLNFFGIKYIDRTIPVENVIDAVQEELQGPGRLLGYRAMHQKLRTTQNIKVPRHLVCNVIADLDPEGVERRCVKNKARKNKIPFSAAGPNWLYSLDGHDKLMGYQNSTFPIAIYGCLDTFSRKIIFLFVWESNSNPVIIGQQYLNHLHHSKKLPNFIRLDRGTETGKLATIHAFLRVQQGDTDDGTKFVIYGPSTSNKIERWWKDLHERMEKFFKMQLNELLDRRDYDPHNMIDRKLLSFLFIPVIQRECYTLTKEEIQKVAELSGVLDAEVDFLDPDLREDLEETLPNPGTIESNMVAEAFRFLKRTIQSRT